MTNRNKEKGSRWERIIVAELRSVGFKARRGKAGATEDIGDVTGVPSWCIEAKDRLTHSFPAYAREAEIEAANYEMKNWAVVAKRKGKPISEAFVLLPFRSWLNLVVKVRDQRREIRRLQTLLLKEK